MRRFLPVLASFALFVAAVAFTHAQVPLTGAGLSKPGAGGGFSPSCSQSSNFLARTSGMDNTHKTATDALICGEVSDSIFNLADIQYLLCQDTSANAALNLQSASFAITVTGSPTFTANSGYVGAAAANLNTNYDPSAGTNLTINSASIFFWTLTNFNSGTSYGAALGQNIAAPTLDLFPHFSDNNFYWEINSTNGDNTTGASPGHFYGVTRSSSTATVGYIDTTQFSASRATTGITSSNIVLLNDGVGGSNARPFSGNLAYAWAGANLTSGQQGLLQARVHTYMQTICGAP